MNWPRLLLRLLGKRLPRTKGHLEVPGIEGPVTIGRDRFGVPHIEAEEDLDAWFGLGFCQGQDRAFQVETRLRLVRGTLAALFGSDLLPVDEMARRIDFAGVGRRDLESLAVEPRRRYEAFAAGVTAGMTRGGGGRAHEFLLLRTKPSTFQASDAIGFFAVQAFSLASNWDVELARLRMLVLDGPQAVADLHPAYPPDQPVSQQPGAAAGKVVDTLAEDLARARQLYVAGGGSNNWALSGDRTASGMPLLANDPHLAPILPAHWYLARIATPEWSVVGGVIPGTPAFGFGHNGRAAWGITAGLIDNTDLFLEEVGSDGASVKRGDAFVPCTVRPETIEVKGGAPVRLEVLETDRGPVVGPAFTGPFGALSMSATWRNGGDAGGIFETCRIQSPADLHEAFRGWSSVPLNVAYADASGNIGWQLIGAAPIRGRGGGTMPTPGSDLETAWAEHSVPYEDLPRVENPAAGIVVTANNLPSCDGPYLGSDFLDGYRAARITELLESRSDWDVAASLDMQMDRGSIPWRQLRTEVFTAIEGAEDLATAGELLAAWDGVVGPDSAAAAVFELFSSAMARMVAEERAPRSSRFALGEGFTPLVPFNGLLVRRMSHLVRLIRERPGGWFDAGWDETIRSALREATATLQGSFGPDPAGWNWGEVRPLTLVHPMGLRKPLDRVWNIGPIAHGGDANTVNPAPVSPIDPLGNPEFAISSGRMVVEVASWDLARFCLAGGQSGNPFSANYGDQVALWRRGDAIVVPFTAAAAARTVRRRLTLRPA